MEISSTMSPRTVASDHLRKIGSDGFHREEMELETVHDYEASGNASSNYHLVSTSALEILRETVWILRKKFDAAKLYVIAGKIWQRVAMTYLWVCMLIVGCLTLFLFLLVTVCTTFSLFRFKPEVIVYPALILGLIFSVVFANCIIICNIAIVISVLEDVSGPQALLRSSVLIRGQTQVGLLIFLGSTIGMAFVEGLFEHRVKTLSYGDGSSRVWEGPLLVIMYSFVVLIDLMMSAVFYYRCKSYCMENVSEESPSVLESLAISSDLIDTQ